MISKALLICREHRFRCFKANINAQRMDEVIKLVEDLKDKKRKLSKSAALRLIADMMDINPNCSNIFLSIEELDSLLAYLFPELDGDRK